MIDVRKLADPFYWFNPGPGEVSAPYLTFFIVLFSFLILMYLLLRFMGRQYIQGLHKAQRAIVFRVEKLLLTLGISGFLWTFFRYELVSFFSARFWLVVWLGMFIIWSYLIFHYVRYQVPKIVARDKEREYKLKYSSSKGKR